MKDKEPNGPNSISVEQYNHGEGERGNISIFATVFGLYALKLKTKEL